MNPEGLEGEIKLQESAFQHEMHARGTKINEEKSQVNMGKAKKMIKTQKAGVTYVLHHSMCAPNSLSRIWIQFSLVAEIAKFMTW